MAEILTPDCPVCSQPPAIVFGGGSQALCGTDDCPILMWTLTKSLDDNLLDASVAELSETEGGEDG
jgi:hypothetical protein